MKFHWILSTSLGLIWLQSTVAIAQPFPLPSPLPPAVDMVDPPLPTPQPPVPPPDIAPPPLPRQRQIVIIDPGHGGLDPGAVGIGGIYEKDIVLDISLHVVALLEKQGIQVILTRPDDRDLDLEPRVQLANQAKAAVFVSIHANAISMNRPEVNGIETFHSAGSVEGQRLAASLQRHMLVRTGMNDRGVKPARFYVLRRTIMPAALVEVGFVTGQEDALNLRDPTMRMKMAEAIVQGILDYLQPLAPQ